MTTSAGFLEGPGGRLCTLLNVLFLGVNVWLLSTSSMYRQSNFSGKVENKEHCLSVERSDPTNNNVTAYSNSFQPEPIHEWCPKKNPCRSTILCEPCKQRYLIIIATGRSGSTTLMEMMGSLPKVRMAGENRNLLRKIYDLNNFLETGANLDIHQAVAGPWQHRPVPSQGLACSCQSFVNGINPPGLTEDGYYQYPEAVQSSPILGFKTIRFLKDIPGNGLSEYLKWFYNSFPCARIVINIRSDVEAQAKSVVRAFNDNRGISKIQNEMEFTNSQYLDLARQLGDSRAYLMDSAEWTKDVTKFHGLIDWLGYSKECYFQYLLEYNTKDYGYGNGKTTYQHDPNCRYTGIHKPSNTTRVR